MSNSRKVLSAVAEGKLAAMRKHVHSAMYEHALDVINERYETVASGLFESESGHAKDFRMLHTVKRMDQPFTIPPGEEAEVNGVTKAPPRPADGDEPGNPRLGEGARVPFELTGEIANDLAEALIEEGYDADEVKAALSSALDEQLTIDETLDLFEAGPTLRKRMRRGAMAIAGRMGFRNKVRELQKEKKRAEVQTGSGRVNIGKHGASHEYDAEKKSMTTHPKKTSGVTKTDAMRSVFRGKSWQPFKYSAPNRTGKDVTADGRAIKGGVRVIETRPGDLGMRKHQSAIKTKQDQAKLAKAGKNPNGQSTPQQVKTPGQPNVPNTGAPSSQNTHPVKHGQPVSGTVGVKPMTPEHMNLWAGRRAAYSSRGEWEHARQADWNKKQAQSASGHNTPAPTPASTDTQAIPGQNVGPHAAQPPKVEGKPALHATSVFRRWGM